jgi:hypothetical protein
MLGSSHGQTRQVELEIEIALSDRIEKITESSEHLAAKEKGDND